MHEETAVNQTRRNFVAGALLASGGSGFLAREAFAADDASWPDRPIRLVVPLPPGGGADIVARLIAEKLTIRLGQSVVVENKAGGGTAIGAQSVATAKPDGYTLLLGTATSHAINVTMVKNLPYNALKDFTPISLVADLPLILVVHPSVPANTLPELVAYVRSRPGKVNFASTGNGSSIQLAGEMLKIEGKLQMTHVPYQGASPALIDVLGGRVEMMFSTIPPVLQHVTSGKLKALCVASPKRTRLMPTLPSTAELGFPGVVANSWNGILAPANAPRQAVERLSKELSAVMQMPDVIDKLKTAGVEPVSNTPQEFAQYIQSEITRYARVVQISGATID
jgi:tripartite-type tricarboxylate transporter receptor subunit TctC